MGLNSRKLEISTDAVMQVIQEIYKARHRSLEQAKKLDKLLQNLPQDDPAYLAWRRLERAIERGEISSVIWEKNPWG